MTDAITRYKRTTVVLAIIVLGLVAVSWNSQRTTNQLHGFIDDWCHSRIANVERLNTQAETLASLDEQFLATGDDLAPAVKDVIRQRVEAYRAGILPVPVCD